MDDFLASFTSEHFHAVLFFVVAAGAGFSRTLRQVRYKSLWNLLGLVGCSGFLSLICISGLSYIDPDITSQLVPGIGVASAAGLMGKELERFLHSIFDSVLAKLLKKIGFDVKDYDDTKEIN